MKITAQLLREHGACPDQVAKFEAEWPDGCELSPETWQRAQQIGLDVLWCKALLDSKYAGDYYAKRTRLYADYVAKRRPFDDEYDAKGTSLLFTFLQQQFGEEDA